MKKLIYFYNSFWGRGIRFQVSGSRFDVQGSRFEVQGSRFKVQGLRKPHGLRAHPTGSSFQVLPEEIWVVNACRGDFTLYNILREYEGFLFLATEGPASLTLCRGRHREGQLKMQKEEESRISGI